LTYGVLQEPFRYSTGFPRNKDNIWTAFGRVVTTPVANPLPAPGLVGWNAGLVWPVLAGGLVVKQPLLLSMAPPTHPQSLAQHYSALATLSRNIIRKLTTAFPS
jgi:hypothetical protein